MELITFIRKNKITVSEKTLNLCQKGLEMMDKSVDPIHDKKHIEDILDYLDFLMGKAPDIKKVVMFDVLLLGICWHDIWKSHHTTNNPFIFVYHQFLDGIGSARIFRKQAHLENISRDIIKDAAFIIRKHSVFNIKWPQKIELSILLDMDYMEMWNISRISKTEGMFFSKRPVYKRTTRLFYKYIARRKLRFNILEELIAENKQYIINSF